MDISVIIPIYNKAEYVELCLESVLEQDVESFEVIAVDDGSTDESGALCDDMARRYPNLRVLHVENGGVTAARRIGLEQARGKYVTFVDADDIMKPQGLSDLLDAIQITNADEVVATYDTHYGKHVKTGLVGNVNPDWMIRKLLSASAQFCVLWGVVFRREWLEGCLDTPRVVRSGEDILMQILYLLKRPNVVFIPDSVYIYTEGLPNERHMTLEEQQTYDTVLRNAIGERWNEFADHYTLRRIKMYENFIDRKMFGVLSPYYDDVRTSLTKNIPLADRIAVMLPPKLAYIPIHLRKLLYKK
ncbi:MAG: glycosyltransferase family 2 protein [Prevotella sp.]